MATHTRPNVIIIGAGPSGIAMAHALKQGLGFEDFMVYDKLDGAGGTWRANTYPGCGCDVPMQLYSFSFNLNPNWRQDLCDQKEILEYMDSTVDKFNLRHHMLFNIECIGAEWLAKESQWKVHFRNHKTKTTFVRFATIFITGAGGLSVPKDVPFEGRDAFKGESFHTARWNHNVDLTGKRMAIIGNGCSAVQLLPNVVDKVASVKQYARSAQWYHNRPNRVYTPFEMWCFKYIPLWQRGVRLSIFLESDEVINSYVRGEVAAKKRAKVEDEARDYIYSRTPEKYHGFIAPTFPLGCKRRIFDPGYLESLHNPKVELVHEGITRITENGIIGTSGVEDQFDIIVYATGFKLSEFLTPMEVIGSQGVSLRQQWKENGGVQAYLGTYIHNFPNFAILFGPNTVPAHGSALFVAETQSAYVARSLVAPIMDRRRTVMEVKETVENEFTHKIHEGLAGSVFESGCSNWYHDDLGHNVANWPGHSRTYWLLTLIPESHKFITKGGSALGYVRMLARWIPTRGVAVWGTLLVLAIAKFGFNSEFLPRSLSYASLSSLFAIKSLIKSDGYEHFSLFSI